ncbi:hypothetical protein GYMLUDRAFT_236605 [Collybiopsis luxurians FD-317 M1]|nr:hypothetical protein GYMLUDRAFT_236605 [Collybiopsis luxurians FD-317 M1]
MSNLRHLTCHPQMVCRLKGPHSLSHLSFFTRKVCSNDNLLPVLQPVAQPDSWCCIDRYTSVSELQLPLVFLIKMKPAPHGIVLTELKKLTINGSIQFDSNAMDDEGLKKESLPLFASPSVEEICITDFPQGDCFDATRSLFDTLTGHFPELGRLTIVSREGYKVEYTKDSSSDERGLENLLY